MRIRRRQILIQGALWGLLLACPALSQERKDGGRLKCPSGGSFGVFNGMAVEMPPPVYPEEVRERGITGIVTVMVIVDRRGRVREARACSGPRELRGAAEDAALKARLRPTLLSGVAVGNRGLLTYAFPPRVKAPDPEPAPQDGTHPPPR